MTINKQTYYFPDGTLTSIQAMRCLRSYRFLLTLSFTVAIVVFIYRFCSISRQTTELSSLNILSNKIDERLHLFSHYFGHVNISMLLNRPSSNRSPSITYRCREWCGGWGDRLRGITSTFILAVLTQRRFYIDMPYPCQLTKFLKPHLYDWQPIEYESNRTQLHIETTRNPRLARTTYEKISSTNFIIDWSQYDDIYLTTNGDYLTPALANKHIQNIVRLLNLTSDESSQARLFPLLYELLFRPTNQVMNLVDQLLIKLYDQEKLFKKQLICLHMRFGKNPTMMTDKVLSHRDTMLEDILQFLDKNLTINKQSILFITSDSMQINQHILHKYNPTQSISIPGPIIHIDRLSSYSPNEQCQGFLKVISDFYVLGECDKLIMARSGFSEWASRRRYLTNQFNQLYLYCRGIHQITGHKWRRPHTIC